MKASDHRNFESSTILQRILKMKLNLLKVPLGRATETQPASEHEPALSYCAPPRQESASASPGT